MQLFIFSYICIFQIKNSLKTLMLKNCFSVQQLERKKTRKQNFSNTRQFIQIKPFTICFGGFNSKKLKLL